MFDTFVEIAEDLAPATVKLATSEDIERIKKWQVTFKDDRREKVQDILEYAHLTLNKLEYYKKAGRCPQNWSLVPEQIKSNPNCELCGLFILNSTALAQVPTLGFTLVRRTWANSLVVDYLGKSPEVVGRRDLQLQGTGVGLLVALCQIAKNLSSPLFWGEASLEASAFYADEFNLKSPTDLFAISSESYVGYLEEHPVC